MNKLILIIFVIIIGAAAETLFEVKDASNNKVLDVSTDGLRIMNQGDTLMVISSSEIRANLESSKGLSRSFSVTTSSSKGSDNDLMRLTSDSTRFWISDNGSGFGVSTNSATKTGLTNLLKVSDNTTRMRDSLGGKYTDFSRYNTFIGLDAGKSTVPIFDLNGKNNVFIGNNAGYTNNGGANNVFIGNEAGYNSNENFNVFIGFSTGKDNVGGMSNTYVGANAGQSSTWGNNNAAFGTAAAYLNKNGSNNSIFGSFAGRGYYDLSYSGNCLFGASAGYNTRTGNNNVMIGYRSGYSNQSGIGNIFIGKDAGYSETGSDKLYIENSNADKNNSLIYGEFDNNILTFNTTKTIVNHASGTTNGLYIQNASYANNWHFYQYSTGGLYLYYNGIQRGTWNTATGVYTSYAKEMKNSVDDIGNVTDKVMKLQPKRYNFTTQKAGEKKYIGLIAQDVQEIFPEFVYYHEEDDIYSIDYAGMSVVAIQAIKEQQSEIDDLRAQINELRELIKNK